ncbi:GntR family transcriptional regulator [soil metagenome]
MALTLSQSISKALAADIVAGILPAGTRLDEQSIAERFDVSRSPVRDALRHLASTRLVQYLPRRGFSVSTIDPENLKDLYEGLTEIEAVCAGLCAMRAGSTERARIQNLHQTCIRLAGEKDYEAYVAGNDELHEAIYLGAHNETLKNVASELRQRLAPLRTRAFFMPSRIESSLQEHAELIDALMRQDSAGAESAMRRHSVHTAVNVLDRLSGKDEPVAA